MTDDDLNFDHAELGGETPEDRQQRERAGVAGDPTPDRDYGDDTDAATEAMLEAVDPEELGVPGPARKVASDLADAGLLTEQQATAYVLRDVTGASRKMAAAYMGKSKSTVDDHAGKARQKVDQARETLGVLADMGEPTPALARRDDADE